MDLRFIIIFKRWPSKYTIEIIKKNSLKQIPEAIKC